MNSFSQAYQQILSKENKENKDNYFDVVEHLKDVIIKHINYFVDKNDYQNYFKFENFKNRLIENDKNFKDTKIEIQNGYQVECEDLVTLRFKVTDLRNSKETYFCIIPDNLIQFINDEFDFCFNGGTLLNPTDDKYFVFLNGFKITKEFRNKRNENISMLNDLKKLEEESKTKMFQEETINDVLLQYIGHFRH